MADTTRADRQQRSSALPHVGNAFAAQSQADIVVGMDGGGTRARAVVLRTDGAEVARVAGPAGLVDARDPAAAAEVMATLATDALAAAGAQPPASALCCGLAGAGRSAEREAVRVALMLRGVAQAVVVVGDAEAAMHDAFGDGPGVLLIAGTGSIAWARGTAGATVRAGGWGALLGDDGSGYAIGLAALRAVARATDGLDAPTTLAGPVLAHARVDDPRDLIAWSGAATKAQIAALAPLVLQCAAAGDAAAARIRETAVAALAELAAHVAAVAHRSARPPSSHPAVPPARGGPPRLALAGGLIDARGPLRGDVIAAVRRRIPQASVVERDVDAALGAARLARAASSPTPDYG